ncbi:hypothetical protein C4A77_00820 [Brevibacillus laterosporus]|uniref:Uncharacterized protein n=1 Tax=Brevibacillus laterosporus TaxID=1465 RepID=A0AAP8U773_BRELA|nr:hypothetical protein C4A77_00820 [Brevibacillus laterosporus]
MVCWYYKCNLSDVEFRQLEPHLIEKILANRLLNDFLNSIDYIPILNKLKNNKMGEELNL